MALCCWQATSRHPIVFTWDQQPSHDTWSLRALKMPCREVSVTISRGKNTSWLKHGQVTSTILFCQSQPFGKSLPRQPRTSWVLFADLDVAPILLCVHLSQDLKGV